MRNKIIRVKRYSEEFKKSRVKEYESGKFTVLELSRLYNFSFQTMYNWIYKYSKLAKQNILIVEDSKSATKKLKDYKQQIHDLQRIVGLKQIELDYLHKLIETAESELGIEIKKNLNTPHLNTSSQTKIK